METYTNVTNESTGISPVRRAYGVARTSVTVYGVLSAAALAAVVAVAGSGHPVNTFMWVRAVLLPLIAVLIHRMTVAAARGSRPALGRVRTIAVVMPVAIIGVDLIPGVCPLWYAAMQAVCMVPIVRLAVLTRGPVLRAAFATGR